MNREMRRNFTVFSEPPPPLQPAGAGQGDAFFSLTDRRTRIKIIKDSYRAHGGYDARLFSDIPWRGAPGPGMPGRVGLCDMKTIRRKKWAVI